MGAVALTTAMTFTPFGVSLETFVLGGVCFFAGSCCRTGTIIGKALEAGQDPHIGRYLTALAFSIPAAAVSSAIVFLATHMMGLQADAAAGGFLLLAGLKGPEGIQWVQDTFSTVFDKFGAGKGAPKP